MELALPAIVFSLRTLAGFAVPRRRAASWIDALTIASLAPPIVLGSTTYVVNWIRFRDPVWPVALPRGPWPFEGFVTQEHILGLRLTEEQRASSSGHELAWSWLREHTPYSFDMRFVGLGVAFAYVILPLAALAALAALAPWRLPRARAVGFVVGVATLAQAGAFRARYLVAFASAAVVLAVAATTAVSRRWSGAARALFVVTLAIGTFQGRLGFSGGRASLLELTHMTPRERAHVASLDGMGDRWFDLRQEILPGEAFARDGSMGLSGLVFGTDGASRLLHLGDAPASPETVSATVDRERVRFVAVHQSVAPLVGPRFLERVRSESDESVVSEGLNRGVQ